MTMSDASTVFAALLFLTLILHFTHMIGLKWSKSYTSWSINASTIGFLQLGVVAVYVLLASEFAQNATNAGASFVGAHAYLLLSIVMVILTYLGFSISRDAARKKFGVPSTS